MKFGASLVLRKNITAAIGRPEFHSRPFYRSACTSQLSLSLLNLHKVFCFSVLIQAFQNILYSMSPEKMCLLFTWPAMFCSNAIHINNYWWWLIRLLSNSIFSINLLTGIYTFSHPYMLGNRRDKFFQP